MFRLILNIILFLGSVLCLIVAPTFRLWIAAIVASEFSWVFLLVSVALLVWSLNSPKFRAINVTLGVLTIAFFMTPMVMAWNIGRTLPQDLASQLGNRARQAQSPSMAFQFSRMITGINAPSIGYQRLEYADLDHNKLTLDFYSSERKGLRPCVVVIHGGSWCGGNSEQLPELNSQLARDGYHVASVNYRLAPKYTSPAPVEDITEALRYLKKHSNQLGIDTGNFILLGRSAGAQLALVTAYTSQVPGIRGVINFYGPTDMVWGYQAPSNPLVLDAKKVMEDFLGGPYEKMPQNYIQSSPVEAVSPSSVPTLIIHGENDALVSYEHCRRLQKKLTDHHIPHYVLSLPWATHGCDYTLNGPSGQLTTYAVEYFVREVVQPTVFETIESVPPLAAYGN